MGKEDKRRTGTYDPKGIGERSESQILALFLKHGKVVLTPFGDNQRYDMVVDEDGDFIRVQCKTASLVQDGRAFTFAAASNNWYRGTTRDYKGQVEVFAVYLPDLDKVYIVDVDKGPKKACTVRLKAPRQRTSPRYRWASDHEFDPDCSLRDYP
jgi:hypothetical protein